MAVYPVLERLPQRHRAELGHIIMRWAYLEWRLRQINYALLGIDPKEGRLAVREPRATDYLTMIQDLAELKRLPLRVDWKKLRKHLGELANHRDRLAHGIWLKIPGHRVPCLQLTKGTWQPQGGGPTYKAKADPVSVPVNVGDLQSVATAINSIIDYLGQVEGAVRSLLQASTGKSSERPTQHHLPPAETEEA